MDEEAVWILDRMYECEAVRPTFECLALVSQALCASGQFTEAWEMLQVQKVSIAFHDAILRVIMDNATLFFSLLS